ncbi:MAG: amino acid racemase [Bacteroidota bacterium]|nr:amino acid racemase [Bacteroidota bacterium]
MKTLGLIGGTSYMSTLDYYRLINEGINKKLGGRNSARILLYSVNFEEEYAVINERGWDAVLDRMEYYAKNLHKAGAESIMLCANTLHMVAERLQKRLELPLIDITEETAKIIHSKKIAKVGLLGTTFSMQESFYPDMLKRYGIECLVPPDDEKRELHDYILDELTAGIFKKQTTGRIKEMIRNLHGRGAEGIILGCTELPLILKQQDFEIPLFDTFRIHADAAL